MSGRMQGRRALVTGAASGIGRATAELFAAQGARLALLDRDGPALAAACEAIGGTALEVDLRDEPGLRAAVERAGQAMGGIDALVNCAGVAGSMPFEAIDREIWDRFVSINLTAPFLLCQTALPYLRAGAGATIVNIASGQALLPNAPGIAAYAATKAGLVAMTKALAAELAPHIRVNAVAPGIVDTPMVRSVLEGYADPDDAPFVQQYALKRVARASELAEVILFLSSDASSYVTGTVVAADGGRTFH